MNSVVDSLPSVHASALLRKKKKMKEVGVHVLAHQYYHDAGVTWVRITERELFGHRHSKLCYLV